jgi:hypothetical protein
MIFSQNRVSTFADHALKFGTVYSTDPDGLHLSVLIEMDDIRYCPRHEATACRLDPETLSRVQRGHPQDLLERQGSIAGHESYGGIHVEIGASKRPVLKRELAALADYFPSVQYQDRLICADRGHGIGDEKYPARAGLGPQGDIDDIRDDVMAVGDQAGERRSGVQGSADETGLAVIEPAHRIEKMRDRPGAGSKHPL